ncbi:hypothetical protein [Sphingomonas sp.]|uniref:hypothetical protein n=1 Tax=Sphingomonas sp. TaxID=28214 RepID=UPI003B3BE814
MDFDQLLTRFFGTADLDTLDQPRLVAGLDEMKVQFGLEQDGGRRFALWCLMYMLGIAPDLGTAFENEGDRDAARDFMDMADSEDDED